MSALIILSLAASALSLAAPALQVLHLRKVRTAAGVNLSSNAMGAMLAGVWMFYGISRSDNVLAITYGLYLFMGLAAVVLCYRFAGRPVGATLLFVAIALGAVGLLNVLHLSMLLSVITVLFTAIRPGMQTLTALRSSDLTGLSFLSFLLFSGSSTLWVVYGALNADFVTAGTSAWCLLCYIATAMRVHASKSRQTTVEPLPQSMPVPVASAA